MATVASTPGVGATVVTLGVVGAVVVVGDVVVAGGAVVVDVAAAPRLAIACWKAEIVATSTTPVGSTPSAVWKSISACVSSSVHTPSIGASQKPTNDRIVCSMTV